MKIFAGPRGSGRTTALVNWVLEDPSLHLGRRLVVLDERRQSAVSGTVPTWTLDHVNTRGWKSWVSLAVDDYDEMIRNALFISNGFGGQIGAVSLESEDLVNIPTPPWMVSVNEIAREMLLIKKELS